MITVVVIANQGVLRGALAAMLSAESDLAVTASATLDDDVPSIIASETVDVLVVDADAPSEPDLAALRSHAEMPLGARVVLLVERMTPAVVRRALDLGARGVVAKDSAPERLAECVRRVAAGDWAIDPMMVMEALTTARNPLTDRERDVLRVAAEGLPARDIATRLFLSEGTVRNHISAAMRKLDASDLLVALRRAEDIGWL